MLRDDQTSWCNFRVLSILAVIFICGVACGSAVTRAFLRYEFRAASKTHSIDRYRGQFEELKKELNLTPQQVDIVTKELDDYAKYYQNIEEQREDVAQMGTERIAAILTPVQRDRFYKMLGISPIAGANAAPVSTVR